MLILLVLRVLERLFRGNYALKPGANPLGLPLKQSKDRQGVLDTKTQSQCTNGRRDSSTKHVVGLTAQKT